MFSRVLRKLFFVASFGMFPERAEVNSEATAFGGEETLVLRKCCWPKLCKGQFTTFQTLSLLFSVGFNKRNRDR